MTSRESRLISDEEEEPEVNLIAPVSAEKSTAVKPVVTQTQVITYNDDAGWWERLKEKVPENDQCRIRNCTFAPQGHRRHPLLERNYSVREMRLIIQYLIHYNEVHNGKGLRVWEEMRSKGYLTHRTEQSLNNNFKKVLLRDIKLFQLPKDVEDRFLELVA